MEHVKQDLRKVEEEKGFTGKKEGVDGIVLIVFLEEFLHAFGLG